MHQPPVLHARHSEHEAEHRPAVPVERSSRHAAEILRYPEDRGRHALVEARAPRQILDADALVVLGLCLHPTDDDAVFAHDGGAPAGPGAGSAPAGAPRRRQTR